MANLARLEAWGECWRGGWRGGWTREDEERVHGRWKRIAERLHRAREKHGKP